MSENRREFFRVTFDQTIEGKLTMLPGREDMYINIENASVTGLKFFSSVDIPLLQKVECSFEVMDCAFLLNGSIIRKMVNDIVYEYGVGFDIDQDTSSLLFKQLNFHMIRQRKGRED